jgi:very-short-patch-repair endonuclease
VSSLNNNLPTAPSNRKVEEIVQARLKNLGSCPLTSIYYLLSPSHLLCYVIDVEVFMFIDLKCSWCNSAFKINSSEYNRCIKRGQKFFFCSRSCCAKKRECEQPDKKIEIEKTCPYCKKKFKTMTGAKSNTFCSRGCASAGSMSEDRRLAQSLGGKSTESVENLIPVEETLKLREAWKYVKLKEFLEFQKECFEFEYRLEDYVFDLALIERKIFVEFDSVYHGSRDQIDIDTAKDVCAIKNGWKVIRKKTINNIVFDINILYDVLLIH